MLLSANDILLARRAVPVAALAPGASDTGSATVTLPVVPAGVYFIIAAADGNNAVAECVESNNSGLFRSIRIGGDLAVTALTAPAKAGPGDTITVTDTTANQGAGAMGAATTTRFYLSTKAIFDTTAVPLSGQPRRSGPCRGSGEYRLDDRHAAVAAGRRHLLCLRRTRRRQRVSAKSPRPTTPPAGQILVGGDLDRVGVDRAGVGASGDDDARELTRRPTREAARWPHRSRASTCRGTRCSIPPTP